VDLIHPRSVSDVVDALRDATSAGRRVLVVGGRRHIDRGDPSEVDAELWTTQLDQVIAYEPADMLVVVQAGMRCGELMSVLAEHGQEWAADAPVDATVGGVIASGSSSPRRLRVGALRDTVVEMELVTGDGRVVYSGARTVKNVTGYDVHRLMTGSLGTLGVITQVALKVRPVAERSITRVAAGATIEHALAVVDGVPLVAGVVATDEGVEVRLEGWAAEVEAMEEAVARAVPDAGWVEHADFPRHPWWTWPEGGTIVEAAVPPSRLAPIVGGAQRFGILTGVGLAWIAVATAEGLRELRERVAAVGGVSPAIRGAGGLGAAAMPAAATQARLRSAFDPGSVLAPGRGWR
jgi:glycolate oxidase FAD binding subunit